MGKPSVDSDIGFGGRKNIGFVVESTLCHGCGTCEAVCPDDAIEMQYVQSSGIYLPDINVSKCTDCELCVQVCSGFRLDLTDRSHAVDRDINKHELIGPYVGIHRAFTVNKERRARAASGGLATEIVDYLLCNKLVEGAIVTHFKDDNPLKAEGYIARSSSELIQSQKSKYCPAPLNQILKKLIRKELSGHFVFVGLPHHVHGLRLVQRLFPHMSEVIPYVVSIFTAHVPSQRATEFILYKKGIKPDDVRMIEYRGGGNPGRMRIVTNDGGEHYVPHLSWIYSGHTFPIFFYPVREWLYFDKLSEWADFSCGDNWMGGSSEQSGVSTVVTRSKAAEIIMNKLITAGRIKSKPMATDDLVKDQDLIKKLNIGARLQVWKLLGRKIPIYTRVFEKKSNQFFRTVRFALYVMLCERRVPFFIMNIIIMGDYYLRAKPMSFIRKIIMYLKKGVDIFLPYKKPEVKKMAKYKVVLIGGYGHKDIGDEAMPHAIRLNLRRALGDNLDLVMLSHSPQVTNEFHGEKSKLDFTKISFSPDTRLINNIISFFMTLILLLATYLEKFGYRLRLWPSAREALDEIASADIVFNVGGGNLNSIIPVELYKKCTSYLVAHILGKPVYLSGQTMGPYSSLIDKSYAKICLNKVEMISFRDKDVSYDRLKGIGVDKPIMFDAADDAITLNGISFEDAKKFLENETGVCYDSLKSNGLVILNMKASLNIFKGRGGISDLSNEIALLAKMADEIVNHFGYSVIFLPTDFSDGVDDRVCHKDVFDVMKNKDSVFLVNTECNDEQLIGIISCADLVIGSRYHFNVFAASHCIPFLGIASGVYQRTKLQGLANLCNLEECYIDLDMATATINQVWPQVENLFHNKEQIHAKLQSRIPHLKSESQRVIDAVVDKLKQ